MCQLIRYHDLFGVISTGEASTGVLIDALSFYSSDASVQQLTISLLYILNLADISGIPNVKLNLVAEDISHDWERLRGFIVNGKGEKDSATKLIINSDQSPVRAIERIRRLLISAAPERADKQLLKELNDVARSKNGYGSFSEHNSRSFAPTLRLFANSIMPCASSIQLKNTFWNRPQLNVNSISKIWLTKSERSSSRCSKDCSITMHRLPAVLMEPGEESVSRALPGARHGETEMEEYRIWCVIASSNY